MASQTHPANPLTPDYYLDHFTQVTEGVQARYDFLLTPEERRHLARLDALSAPARMLYARLVNRRGPCFRVEKLAYPEIGPLDPPLSELLRDGLLDPCREMPDPALRERLFACFTHLELKTELKADLKAGLGRHVPPRHARKDELLTWLGTWDGGSAWLAAFLAKHMVVSIPKADPWPFLRFLFFGAMRDNLADFVTRALGQIVTETIDTSQLTAHFASRQEADDAYRMAALYAEFRRVRSQQTARQTLDWWQAQAVDRAALAAGADWFDRLIDRLGRLLEREGQAEAALALYATSPVAPARERRTRLLIKKGESGAASALLHAMRDAPCHAEEAYAARQLLARLEKTAKRSEARHYQHGSRRLVLDYLDGGAEAAALAHYRAQGWQGVHSENWLWNAGFGLLLWDIIYDPGTGAFHSPLQMAPADLHGPAFYARRQSAIETRLAMLTEPAAAASLVRRHFEAKQGLINPFVCWHDDLPDLLGIMLHRLPPLGLAAALRHLARDVRRHSSGLPDLFLWNESDYRFIEIKAENDHLSGHQYEWLRLLDEAGIRVSLEKIERPRRKLEDRERLGIGAA
jgi:hypothetical protein